MSPTHLENAKGPLDLIRQYWRILLKWKWTSFLFIFLVLSGAAAFSFLVTPIFTASGSVWIDDETKLLPFEQEQTLGAGNNMQSHVFLLQSRSLAAETIKKLKLNENPEFFGPALLEKKWFNPENPLFREKLIGSFVRSVSVTPVTGTRLVYVRFNHRNPQIAALVLNALFDGYVEMIVKKRSASSERSKEALGISIAAVRAEIDEREKQLSEYSLKKDFLPLTAAESPTVAKLADFNTALTAATIDRINKLNYYNQIKSAPLGEIPDAPVGSIIQGLRTQYSALSREYATKLLSLQPEYPEMKRLKSELDAATTALQTETQNLIRIAFTDYQAALRQEQSIQRELDALKNEAYKNSSDSVYYNSLRLELESKKTLLDTLTQRQSETDVSSRLNGLEAINVWIVDKADPPLIPTFPNPRKFMILGLMLGLAGGVGLALGLEYANQSVKSAKDVTLSTGFVTLGSIPSFEAEAKAKGPVAEFKKIAQMIRGGAAPKKRKAERKKTALDLRPPENPTPITSDEKRSPGKIELIASRKPHSIQAESYRSIRTTLLVSTPVNNVKSIIFTSPLAGEGKSSTVSNLGVTLAAAQLKIVIVDTDLRKPKQHRIFNQDGGPGLTRFLSSEIDPADLAVPTQIPNLSFISSGPHPSNPIELLSSTKMIELLVFLKRSYDYVLFDTPPILAVSDALALGSLVDAIILVCRGGQTPLAAMRQAKNKFEAHRLECMGVIINGVNLVEQDGYYAREYSRYSRMD